MNKTNKKHRNKTNKKHRNKTVKGGTIPCDSGNFYTVLNEIFVEEYAKYKSIVKISEIFIEGISQLNFNIMIESDLAVSNRLEIDLIKHTVENSDEIDYSQPIESVLSSYKLQDIDGEKEPTLMNSIISNFGRELNLTTKIYFNKTKIFDVEKLDKICNPTVERYNAVHTEMKVFPGTDTWKICVSKKILPNIFKKLALVYDEIDPDFINKINIYKTKSKSLFNDQDNVLKYYKTCYLIAQSFRTGNLLTPFQRLVHKFNIISYDLITLTLGNIKPEYIAYVKKHQDKINSLFGIKDILKTLNTNNVNIETTIQKQKVYTFFKRYSCFFMTYHNMSTDQSIPIALVLSTETTDLTNNKVYNEIKFRWIIDNETLIILKNSLEPTYNPDYLNSNFVDCIVPIGGNTIAKLEQNQNPIQNQNQNPIQNQNQNPIQNPEQTQVSNPLINSEQNNDILTNKTNIAIGTTLATLSGLGIWAGLTFLGGQTKSIRKKQHNKKARNRKTRKFD